MKLTEWYPIKTPPVRLGVYQVYEVESDKGVFYSYWNGKHFNWLSCGGADTAFESRMFTGAGKEVKGWRGLSERPK